MELGLGLLSMLTTPITFFETAAAPGPIGTPSSLGTTGSNPGGTTATHTTTAAIVAGNLALVAVTINSNNSVTASSVSDGTNTYTKVAGVVAATFTEVSLWYKENASAVSSGATITVTLSGTPSSGACRISAAQVSGIITASSLDKSATNSGNSVTSVSVSTGTLAQANELIIGVQGSLTGTSYSGASGFTNVVGGTATVFSHIDYQIVSATTSVTYTPTTSASALQFGAVVASFKGNP